MKTILNIAVCDDEQQALSDETELIKAVFEDLSIGYRLDMFNDPQELLTSDTAYDMVFLDIEMDKLNGIELARAVLEKSSDCFIFFITNYSVYLDRAFDVKAFRYLSKPVDRNRLKSGIATAIERMAEKTKIISITNHTNKLTADISIASIIFIENTGRHTHIVTTQYEFIAEEVFSAIKRYIESEVNYFAMPHQSYYVNLRFVCDYTRERVRLTCSGRKYEAYMSRRCYKAFDAKIFEMAKTIR